MRFDRNRLLSLRESLDLNQVEAAAKIGVTRQSLDSWEKGKSTPSIGKLDLIGKAYGVPGKFFLVEEMRG